MMNSRFASVSSTVAALLLRSSVIRCLTLFAALAIPIVGQGQGTSFIEVETIAGTAGASASILTTVEPTADINGISFGLCFDSSILQFASLTPCGTCSFEFFEDVLTAEGIGAAIITSFTGATSLQAGISHPVTELAFTVASGAVGFVPVSVCVLTTASPELQIVLSDPAGTELPTTLVPGGVDLAGGAVEFIRGDFNSDGSVAILDAISLLTWGFLNGPAPSCLASADFDGNGTIQITLEAINLLSFLFLSATPPSAPFPGCGVDPQADCLDSGSSCNFTA